MMATMETPHRVRMQALPMGWFWNGESGAMENCRVTMPGTSLCSSVELHGQVLAAQQVAQGGGLIAGQRNGSLARVGIVPGGNDEFGLAFPQLHHADPASGSCHEVLPPAEAGKICFIHVHGFSLVLRDFAGLIRADRG